MVALQCADDSESVLQGEAFDITDRVDELRYVNLDTLELEIRQDYELDALPLPCTVTIEGVDYRCDEQPEIEFDVPGRYTVMVDAGPRYLKKEFVIENPA
ncbi:hypothetical protein HNR62_000283 [Oceanisphaera litoralis]|uniref:hypothetical protein n=1 Tax=Oceanisphaera litoralis TaxID=225144 RepID=UPI00195C071C|nr:hypothetical protein [Oceanisphaera litoralis]MBM7454454.1 hypothetical protein [Oceanisphaera litoralis]